MSTFGFIATRVSEVGMGEDLSPISISKFCRYAPETVVASLQRATPRELEIVKLCLEKYGSSFPAENIGKISSEDMFFQDENPKGYSVNPFWVNPLDNSISIGETYTGIAPEDFAYYTVRTLAGGWIGWGSGNVPEEAIQGFNLIKNAVNKM